MLIEVNPGKRIDFVEVDLRGFAFRAGRHEEVDARQAGAIAGPEGGEGHGADAFGVCCAEFGGDDADAFVGAVELVLGLVVVELLGGNDFANHAGLGSVVAEDGDLEFARFDARASNALFDDEFAVEAGSEIHGGGEIGAGLDLADSDRGAEVGGLYEDRVGEGLFEEAGAFLRVGAPLGAEQGDMRCQRKTGGEEETLHGVLVHAGG